MKIFLHPFKPARLYSGKGDWYVYYHYRDPDTGKWVMFKDRSGLNYKELKDQYKVRKSIGEELRDTYNERLKAGWSPFGYTEQNTAEYDEIKFLPVIKVFDKLLETKKSTLRRRTWQSYKYAIDIFRKWLLSNNMNHVTPEFFKEQNARAFADYMLASGKYKNKTFNGHINIMKLMFNMCMERELVVKNPFRKIKPLPVEVGKNFPFTESQKKELRKAIMKQDPELWKFVKCIYHLFIRPLELLRLKISDVDLRTGQVVVPASASKNKRQMAVEIPETFMDEIRSWKLDQYPADWYLFGYDLKPGPNHYHRNSVTTRHTNITKELKIDKRHSLYSWKHTGNIDSYLAGIDVYDLMRQNRHHSLEQTMNYLRSMGLRPNVNFSKKAPAL